MQKKPNIPVITIDGPSGSGKGTIAQLLAKALGWHYLIDVISGLIIASFSLVIAEYCYLMTRKCDDFDLDAVSDDSGEPS